MKRWKSVLHATVTVRLNAPYAMGAERLSAPYAMEVARLVIRLAQTVMEQAREHVLNVVGQGS
jgi:hypothetical protein